MSAPRGTSTAGRGGLHCPCRRSRSSCLSAFALEVRRSLELRGLLPPLLPLLLLLPATLLLSLPSPLFLLAPLLLPLLLPVWAVLVAVLEDLDVVLVAGLGLHDSGWASGCCFVLRPVLLDDGQVLLSAHAVGTGVALAEWCSCDTESTHHTTSDMSAHGTSKHRNKTEALHRALQGGTFCFRVWHCEQALAIRPRRRGVSAGIGDSASDIGSAPSPAAVSEAISFGNVCGKADCCRRRMVVSCSRIIGLTRGAGATCLIGIQQQVTSVDYYLGCNSRKSPMSDRKETILRSAQRTL